MDGNSVLITFDSVVNTDFGIIKTLQKDYNNPKFYIPDILNNEDDFIRYSTIMNHNNNIVSYYLNDENQDKADSIRNMLLDDQYEKVLENSEPTGVFTVANQFRNTGNGAIRVTILCKNELEQQYIKSLDRDMSTLIEDITEVNTSLYDSFYMRDINNAIKLKNLKAKNLFVLVYRFNFEDEFKTLLRPITALVGDINEFYTIDVYSELDIGVG